MKWFLLFFILVMFSSDIAGQSYGFKRYDVGDGLPSSQVYEAWEDGLGYVWFTTDRGVSRFDGRRFVNYSQRDGLVNNTVFKFTAIDSINFMVNDITGKFSLWDGNSFSAFEFNNSFEKLKERVNPSWFVILELDDDFLKFSSTYGNCNLYNNVYQLDLTKGNVEKVDSNYIFRCNSNISTATNYCMISSGLIDCPYNDFIRSIDLSHTSTLGSIRTIFINKDGSAIVMSNTGVYMVKKKGEVPVKILEDKMVISGMQQKNGSYWFTTLTNGVYYVPSIKTQVFRSENSDKVISSFHVLKNKLYGRSVHRQILEIVPSIDRGIDLYEVDNTIKSKIYKYKLSNGKRLFNTIKGFCVENEKIVKRGHDCDHRITIRSLCVAEDNNGHAWVGTIGGLYIHDIHDTSNSFKKIDIPFASRDPRVSKIEVVGDGLWFSAHSDGLLYYRNNEFLKIKDNRLLSDLVHSINAVGDSVLWVATNKGLNKIKYEIENDKLVIINIESFNSTKGLASDYILDVIEWQGVLYLATNDGISYVNINDLKTNTKSPHLNIESIKANNIVVGNNTTLDYNQNNIVISYHGVSMNRLPTEKNCYRYRINNDPLVYSSKKSISLYGLNPGKYNCEFEFQDINYNWSSPQVVSFKIQPHFTQKKWFKFLVIGSLILLLIYYFIKREKTITAENLKQNTYRDIELSTLRRQLNPHFIFNSLNTLQGYIFGSNPIEANEYLGEFSHLIRSSFEYTMMKNVTVKQEIEFIEDYLRFEHKRFKDKFDYEVIYDSSLVDKSIYIPPLMTQPIIENAIKHAFKDINKKGFLSVKYKLVESSYLSIVIEDNGDGFNEINDDLYNSYGLSLIQKRIDLLKEKHSGDIGNLDVFSEPGKGVRVEIVIPFVTHKKT